MAPANLAYVFVPLGIVAGFAVARDIQTGESSSRGWTFTAADNPLGYLAAISGKLFMVGLGGAYLLFSAGVVDDPWLPISAFHALGLRQ